MQLDCPQLDFFIPDGSATEAALQRTTHLGIGAHPDDLEIIAIHGILECFDADDRWFAGVVTCDGAGSPRGGPYADYSDRQMADTRREEQRDAARLGRYGAQIQLGYPSAAACESGELADNLTAILSSCQPHILYMHNLADAHATHRAVAKATLAALRRLAPAQLPAKVYGVEVWRSLDWLPQPPRVSLPLRDEARLQATLLRCHNSQISGGKRYDEAILARQAANATLAESHDIDRASSCVLAMDLSELVGDPTLSADEWLARCVEAFRRELTG